MSITQRCWQLFSDRLTVPLIMTGSNGPRPAAVFCTLGLTPVSTLAPRHVGGIDADGNRKVSSPRVLAAQVQCFGTGALDTLDTLASTMQTEAAINAAEALDIGVLSLDRLQSVPSLVDATKYEERAILDCTLNYVGSAAEWVSWIETVEGVSTISGLVSVPWAANVA